MSEAEPHERIDLLFPDSQEKIDTEWFTAVMKDKFPTLHDVTVGTISCEAEGALGLLIPFDAKIKDPTAGDKDVHFVVKIKADLSEMYNDIKPLLFHPRESFAYRYMLPLFEAAAKDVVFISELEQFTSFYCKSHLAAYDIPNSRGVVVLENLKKDGFDLLDFSHGLSLPQAKLAVKTLAYHHALSHLLISKKQDQIDSEKYKQFLNWVPETSLLSVWGMFLAEGLRWFSNSHPEEIELESKLNQLASRSAEILGAYTDYGNGGLPVICHGDFWCNNIMYRRKQGEDAYDIKLVDLQCVAHGTPGKDLATLILSSLSFHERKSSTEDILQCYHASFQQACELLKLPKNTLTYENLQQDYKSSLLNGVLWCFVSFQMFLDSEETEERLFWILSDMAREGVF